MERLGFAIGGRDTLLTPDPVWGDGIGISTQHGLLVKLPGTDVWFKREGRPWRPRFPLLPVSFVSGAPPAGRGRACFLPHLGPVAFGDPRAAAPSPAAAGFPGSNGDVFLRPDFGGSLRFLQVPGTNLRHIVEVPARL